MEKEQHVLDAEALAASRPNGNPKPDDITANAGLDAKHEPATPSSDSVHEHLANHSETIAAAVAPGLQNPKIAAIYTAVRPLLKVVQGILFFHPAWVKGIKAFIIVMDAEFPTAVN